MVFRIWLVTFCILGLIVWSTTTLNAEDASPGVPDFEKQSSAFLANYCTSCHGADDQEAGLRFDDLPFDLENADTSTVWRRILEQVLFSEMPPEEGDEFPSADERSQFVAQVEAELTRFGSGLSLDEKMLLPEYGNFVDHEKLFSGEIQDKSYTPARLWRQRPDIYRRIWGKHYGRKHWYSVKIGGNQRKGDLYTVKRGPQKGKAISGRYFADQRFANPFYEYVHHASGFTDYASTAYPAISAAGKNKQLPFQCNPELAYQNLFGSIAAGGNIRKKYQRTGNVLDAMAEDIRKLRSNLPSQGKEKLDHYLSGFEALKDRRLKLVSMQDVLKEHAPEVTDMYTSKYSTHHLGMADGCPGHLERQAEFEGLATWRTQDMERPLIITLLATGSPRFATLSDSRRIISANLTLPLVARKISKVR